MALWEPFPSFFQSLPIWVAAFVKFLLGLALIVCDEAGEKGKALHAMGGHPVRQPTPGVGQSWGRREGQALDLMTSSITRAGCHPWGVGAGSGERRGGVMGFS